jgi:hypothetical membrane protein
MRRRFDIVLIVIVVYVAATVALHFAQPELDPLEVALSYYVYGRHGWLLTVSLVALGIASLVLTVRLRRAMGEARRGWWLIGIWSVGLLLGAVFRADPPGHWNRRPSLTGAIHGNVALVAFIAFPIGALIVSRWFRRDPRWQSRATPLWILAIVAAVSFAAFVASLIPVFVRPGPPILLGLTERIALVAYAAWLVAAARTIA